MERVSCTLGVLIAVNILVCLGSIGLRTWQDKSVAVFGQSVIIKLQGADVRSGD